MYKTEVPLHDHEHCNMCGQSLPAFKCKDCNHIGLYCQSCVLSEHQTRPFHNILQWNGDVFMAKTLFELGFVWNIGHGSTNCRKADGTSGNPQKVTIIDINGVHEVNILWCGCRPSRYMSRNSHMEQLLENELFPATPQRIRTVFTFRAMKQFHLLHLQGKMNAWEWCATIIRLTDNVLPGTLTVSPAPCTCPLSIDLIQSFYNVFLRAYRQWALLKCLRRSGFINAREPRPNGVFRVKCPACPQPQVNLPLDWEMHPNRYASGFEFGVSQVSYAALIRALLFAQFLGADGNFRLCRFKKGCDSQNEPSWMGDAGYFTPLARTKEFLKKRDKDEPQPKVSTVEQK